METNDINDIQSRLDRILFAANSIIDNDYKRHAKIDPLEVGVKVTLPAKDGPIKIKNDIFAILHHLATVKDHLKKHMERNRQNKQLIERAIDSSIHLKVLIDLVNADKHGYPTTTNRSKKNPVIKDFAQSLKNNNEGKPVIATISPTGEINIVEGKAPSVELFANIYDDQGSFLFGFNELVEVCYKEWLSIAEQYITI